MTPSLEQQIATAATAAGFDAIGIAGIEAFKAETTRRLEAFVEAGHHGDMDWMATHADRRGHPARLWPEARSAVMLGMSYGPDTDPLAILGEPLRGGISVYARGKDYHEVVKPRLKQVAGLLHRRSGCDVKVFVDTAPLMEKPLAMQAGIGWQGKHTNLVSRDHGSWLFLGAILTTAVLAPNPPQDDHCGSCTRCLTACPTNAFLGPYRLDARRCISYLTIEHKGMIDRPLRAAMGNRIYGCDDCLAVCPWNKFAREARETRFKARTETDNPPLADLLALDDASFRTRFAGTPVKRTGRDRFLRNVLIAAGNARDRTLVPRIEPLLADPSPIVRGTAVWALARLMDRTSFEALAQRQRATEANELVQSEWEAELRR